jgi:DNA-binding NtrC family response regulator
MPKNPRKLIVFQDKSISPSLYEKISAHQWKLYTACDLNDAIDLIKNQHFSAGLCLIGQSDDESYVAQLADLFNTRPKMNWVLGIAGVQRSVDSITYQERKLIAEYCHDFVFLPIEIERLLFALGRAYEMAEVSTSLDQKPLNAEADFHGIIGSSPAMRTLIKQIEKIAKEDYSVLIEGETGTGKELVANAIHASSGRAGKPLVAINCCAIPQELVHTELFGYEKGAFSGAHQRKIGRIESANGGTLFLDEIGDLPISQQAHLLRFLEGKTIERLGGAEKIPVDVRVIAATHVDLKKAVENENFREDLYYRLKVLQIKTPRLCDRGQDIELLALNFFDQFSKGAKRKAKGFTSEALHLLQQHDWPGNIRELMNCIGNAVVMSENRLLTSGDLGLDRRKNERSVKPLEEARADADRETILASIKQSDYNLTRAASDLGISRVSLYRLIEKYQLKI